MLERNTKKLAPVVMIQGTASSVGKSLITSALCRIFARKGVRVAPFKAQNMSLNASVLEGGGEIGCAQMLQAQACRITADARMNPVLLKPESNGQAQQIVCGRPYGVSDAAVRDRNRDQLKQRVLDCLRSLREEYDLVFAEGAGSPAEINLRDRDMVNMFIARAVGARVVLVGDIDRGGVFAALYGTLKLLPESEQDLVHGLLINKFRGRRHLLESGLDQIEALVHKPVLGVVPMLQGWSLPDEDSVPQSAFEGTNESGSSPNTRGGKTPFKPLSLVILRYPYLSNCDEFDMLHQESELRLRFCSDPESILEADLLILPGSKQTVTSLHWLQERGLERVIARRIEQGGRVMGICGGAQMLGHRIEDPEGVESPTPSIAALGILPLRTLYGAEKQTRRTTLRPSWPPGLDETISGYEIHAGRLSMLGYPEEDPAQVDAPSCTPFGVVSAAPPSDDRRETSDGAIDGQGRVVATMQHGLFESTAFRRAVLDLLWADRGQATPSRNKRPMSLDERLEKLADHVEGHMQLEWIETLLDSSPHPSI